jgi:thiol:disulfide interchange protein DsbD
MKKPLLATTLLLLLVLGHATFAVGFGSKQESVSLANLNPLHVQSVDLKSSQAAGTATHSNEKFKPGETLELRLKLNLDPGFHAYIDQYKLKLVSPADFYLSEFQIQPTVRFTDPISKKTKIGTESYAEMVSLLEIPKSVRGGTHSLQLELTYQACGADFCLFPKTVPITHDLVVEGSSGNLVADALAKGWWYTLFVVFVAGLLTSLTPCIFPMIPITIAVLGANDSGRSKFEGFLISLFYVFGIAITYATLGVVAAKTGALFGSLLGHPVVVTFIALIFVLMALSLFGLFEIRAPDFITQKLGNAKTKKNFAGAFLSGLIAGVVASPCVGPVLIGILAYVAQTQDIQIGFILLFTFALGLGQLFLFIGTFNHLVRRLPRSGGWMTKVKVAFGVLMLGMALYYVYPVLPKAWLAKLKGTTETSDATASYPTPKWVNYSEEALANALATRRPVIIDFKAEWCLACKELELYTFSDPQVLNIGERFLWLSFDATSPSDELSALQKKYGIGGLPFIVIYDDQGHHRPDLTLTGFEKADAFLNRIQKAIKK